MGAYCREHSTIESLNPCHTTIELLEIARALDAVYEVDPFDEKVRDKYAGDTVIWSMLTF
jgi:hypothetical protein